MRTNIEESLTKLVRLVANLCTDEPTASPALRAHGNKAAAMVARLAESVSRRKPESAEEFVLNSVSCITNVLFYDIPPSPLLSHPLRLQIYSCIKSLLLYH